MHDADIGGDNLKSWMRQSHESLNGVGVVGDGCSVAILRGLVGEDDNGDSISLDHLRSLDLKGEDGAIKPLVEGLDAVLTMKLVGDDEIEEVVAVSVEKLGHRKTGW